MSPLITQSIMSDELVSLPYLHDEKLCLEEAEQQQTDCKDDYQGPHEVYVYAYVPAASAISVGLRVVEQEVHLLSYEATVDRTDQQNARNSVATGYTPTRFIFVIIEGFELPWDHN